MEINDSEFKLLKELIYKLLGIYLLDSKRELLISRLSSRLRELKLETVGQYLHYISTEGNEGKNELTKFINKVTTNETSFFREKNHFDYLISTILPTLFKKKNELRFWSAACSSGEEPYSLALVLNEYLGRHPREVKILATDVNTSVLSKAQEGLYKKDDILEKVPHIYHKYFQDVSKTEVKIKDDVKKIITFKYLNFMDKKYPINNPIDIIFCRNAMIYFNDESRNYVVNKFYDHLSDDGYFIIGHSENLFNFSTQFKLITNNIYTKVTKK